MAHQSRSTLQITQPTSGDHFRKKSFDLIFLVWFNFFLFGSVWFGFYFIFLVWVRFTFFNLRLIKLKPNQNRKKLKKNQTSFSFRFNLVFFVWLNLVRFFFQFFLVWVRFGFFSFRPIKLKPNRTEPVGFFKILIGFFSRFDFFSFLDLINFSVFLLTLQPTTPNNTWHNHVSSKNCSRSMAC